MKLADDLLREMMAGDVAPRVAPLMHRAALILARVEAACDVLERQSDEALAAAAIELRVILREDAP